MAKAQVQILDCTLRDGGYVNDWNFGQTFISNIVENISSASVDLIECGFLSMTKKTSEAKSIFSTVEIAEKYFENVKQNNLVLMINCGEYQPELLEKYCNGKIKTIRIAFHKHQFEEAQRLCIQLKKNGFHVFFQPMVTSRYTDEELLSLIRWTNENKPDAFYIVDSFGTMRKKDVLRMFYLVDNNLHKDIKIGFHSHNNLQLSFSNAQELLTLNSERELIIDTSVMGMGRGAGNLCTELMIQYINENIENKYDVIPILQTMDEYIMPISKTHSWGYSIPYYIAAVNDCHPNYATYLSNMQTLFVKDINTIIKMIAPEKKYIFDKQYINRLYAEYQQKQVNDEQALECIRKLCQGRQVLVLAPGKTLRTFKEKIQEYIKVNNPVVFSINHIPEDFDYDRVFVSNLKRFKGIKDAVEQIGDKLICTSNISTDKKLEILNYSSYLNEDDAIFDNSGTMVINILKRAGVSKIALAGYDGFDENRCNNYYSDKMIMDIEYEKMAEINNSIINYFKKVRNIITIEFITPSIYTA